MKTRLYLILLLVIAQVLITHEVRSEWIKLPLDNPGAETGDLSGWKLNPNSPGTFQAIQNFDDAYQGEWFFLSADFDIHSSYISQTIDLSAYRGRMIGLEFGAYFDIINDAQTRIGYDIETDREYEYYFQALTFVSFFDEQNNWIPGGGTRRPDIEPGWHFRSVNTLNWDQDQWETINKDADHASVIISFGYSCDFGTNSPQAYQIDEWRQWLGDEPVVKLDSSNVRIEINDFIWSTQYVDCGKTFENMTDRSLKLDSDGYPHIAYGSGHLYYAWFDGSAWQRELVDPDYTTGQYASLALDEGNHPHIIYYDFANGNLKYAYKKNTSGWSFEVIAYVEKYGVGSSIALDDDGNPHISYNYYDCAVPGGYLVYGRRDGAGWHFETINNEISFGDWSTSIVLDENGNPNIGYCYTYTNIGEFNGMLKYATRDHTGWHTQTVDFIEGVDFEKPSIVIDLNGNPHISYSDNTNFDLKYAFWNGSDWQIEILDTSGSFGMLSSITFSANGYPHISYFDGSNQKLKYVFKDIDGWHITVIGNANDTKHTFMFTSIDLDQNDRAHISYIDGSVSGDSLKYAFWNGSDWQVTIIDQTENIGYGPSIGLDQNSYPHISYLEQTNYNLKYAFMDETGWHTKVVDSTSWNGFPSFRVDENGFSHIAYCNSLGLRYAFNNGYGWEIEFVDCVVCAGDCSLDIDQGGYPHISHYEGTNDESLDLKYTFKDASGWNSETIDSGVSSYSLSSICLDQNNVPHISYQGINDDLKYAKKGASGWEVETIDSEGRVYNYSCLDIDSNGYPHISYVDTPNSNLKYAYKDVSGWHLETLPIAGFGIRQNSIAVDTLNYPHIIYYDHVDWGAIRYIYKTAIGWHNELIDDAGYVGGGSGISLELDKNDYPHACYYDATCGCLKYSRKISLGLDYDYDKDLDVDGRDLKAFIDDFSLLENDLAEFANVFGITGI